MISNNNCIELSRAITTNLDYYLHVFLAI